MYGQVAHAKVWRPPDRSSSPPCHTLHRQDPTAITYTHDNACSPNGGAVAGVRVCGTCCGYCVAAATARAWYWKMLLLFLLLLTTSQLYFNVLLYRNTQPLFSINATSSSVVSWSADDGKPFLKEQWEKFRLSWIRKGAAPERTYSGAPGSGAPLHHLHHRNGTPHSAAEQQHHGRNTSMQGARGGPSSSGGDQLNISDDSTAAAAASRNMTTVIRHKSLLSDELPPCPPVPPDLAGHVVVNTRPGDLELEERLHPELLPGGRWGPPDCASLHRVALIIPYRARRAHLAVLLRHLHPFLQRQQLDYTIFVVEQAGKGKFNRALLMNIGALESLKLYPYQCFVFHDIDLLPEDDRNLYSCPQQPRHMSVAINIMRYKLPYNDIFGGVSALTVDQLRKVNGFSNKFWGWGGEDDDMSNRIKFHGLYISRYPASIARYTMLEHKKDKPNPQRYQFLYDGKRRFSSDGLNSAKYRVLDLQLRKLYTWIYVETLKS